MANDLADVKITVSVDDKDVVKAYKSFESMKKQVGTLELALRKGEITNKTYNRAISQISRDLGKATGDFKNAQSAVMKWSYAIKQATDEQIKFQTVSGKGMKQFQLAVQQAGYQVGDFFTQVAMGQNAIVAFSTQATQLAGFFSGPWGAAIGAGISILGALYVAFDRMEEKAGLTSKEIAETIATARMELVELQTGMDKTEQGILANLEVARNKARELGAYYTLLQESFAAAPRQGEAVVGRARQEYEDQIAVVQELIAQLEEYQDILADIEKTAKRNAEQESYNRRIASLKQENDLLRIRREYGEDSKAQSDYLIAQKELELQALVKEGLLTEDQLKAEMELVREQVRLNEELEAAGIKGEAFADSLERAASAMASLTSFGANIDKQLAVAVAQVEALRNGQDAAVAGNIAGQREELNARTRAALAADPANALVINATAAIERAKINQLEAALTEGATLRGQQGAGSSEQKDYLAGLLQETQFKARLIGLSEEDAAVQTTLNNLVKAGVDLSDDRVQILLEEEKQLRELEKSQKSYQETVSMVENNLTQAFNSILSGSMSVVDAFRNMMRQILATVLQQKFITPLVSSVVGAVLPSAVGAATGGLAAGAGAAGLMSSIGTGLGSGFMTSVYGGLTGTVGAVSGGIAAGGAQGFATAIGAAAAPVLALAAAISFFKKKTKELDNGLKVTVNNLDSFIESFQTIQTSRFWGLSKKTNTYFTEAEAMVAEPIQAMIFAIQDSIFRGAEYIGAATSNFQNFSYEFETSLKGLTDDQKLEKVTEELNKMGDAFAELIPNISSLQELNDVVSERYSIETRLYQALGDVQTLRERELATVNDYNKELLMQVYAAEDAAEAINKVTSALNEADFATLLDFQRAKARVLLGLPQTEGITPSATSSNTSGAAVITQTGASTISELRAMRAEMKQMHEETMFAYSKITKNGKDTRDTLRSWDVVGLPPERT